MLIVEFSTSSRAGWIACAAMLIFLAALLVYRQGAKQQIPALRERWRQTKMGIKLTSFTGLIFVISGNGWLLDRQSRNITGLSRYARIFSHRTPIACHSKFSTAAACWASPAQWWWWRPQRFGCGAPGKPDSILSRMPPGWLD